MGTYATPVSHGMSRTSPPLPTIDFRTDFLGNQKHNMDWKQNPKTKENRDQEKEIVLIRDGNIYIYY